MTTFLQKIQRVSPRRIYFVALLLLAPLAALRAEQVVRPEVDPPSGFLAPTNITMSCATSGADIRYTTDGTLPSGSSTLYSTAVPVTGQMLLRIRAFKSGLDPSESIEARYDIPQGGGAQLFRAVTNAGPSGIPYVELDLIPDATAAYVGIEETIPESLVPSAITGGGTWLPNRRQIRWPIFSTNQTFSYELAITNNRTYVLPGTYGSVDGEIALNGQDVILFPAGMVFTNPVAALRPDTVLAPEFLPDGGIVAPTQVVISCSTAGAVVRYTLDGSQPTLASPVYAGPIAVVDGSLLRAQAFKAGLFASTVRTARYGVPVAYPTLDLSLIGSPSPTQTVIQVTPDPDGCWAVEAQLPPGLLATNISHSGVSDSTERRIRWGSFDDTSENLSFDTTGHSGTYLIRIYASVDGQGSWSSYETAITVPGENAGTTSPPPAPETVATPVLDPASSTTLPLVVAATSATAGAAIHYTTDGSTPTTADPLFPGSFNVIAETTLRVQAFKAGFFDSGVAVGRYGSVVDHGGRRYIRTVGNSGTYLPNVSLDVYPGSNILCQAIFEQLPDGLNAINISDSGVWLPATRQIRWGSVRDGLQHTFTYELTGAPGSYYLRGTGSADGGGFGSTGDTDVLIDLAGRPQVAVPTFDQPLGTPIPLNVGIACSTPGVEIRYTLDGTEPTAASPLYASPLQVLTGTELKARAFRALFQPSDTASAIYSDDVILDGTSLIRLIQGNGGATPTVQLSARAASDVRCYGIHEHIPVGVDPDQISDNGIWSADTRIIRWGPWLDDGPRDVSYRASGTNGLYVLDGIGGFNGLNLMAGGQQIMLIQQDALTHRELIDPWTANAAMNIGVTPRTGAVCYAVLEYLPEGITATNINENGVWSTNQNAVKWGPFRDAVPRTFSYGLAGNGQLFETKSQISVDGVSQWVLNEIQAAAGLPAPFGVQMVAGDESAGLSWRSTGHEAGIKAYYWTMPNRSDEQVVDLGFAASQPFFIGGLINGVRVYAELTAYDSVGGESPASSVVTTIPHDGSGVPGFLYFDAEFYASVASKAFVTLEDNDLNLDGGVMETAVVYVASSEDAIGIPLTLWETAPDSGVFETRSVPDELLAFTYESSDAANRRLRIGDGMPFTVTYWDTAPPAECRDTALFGYYDADGDGMWDTFERRHFGSIEARDGTLDSDTDGFDDWSEGIAGTDPTDLDSYLKIESIAPAASQATVVIHWINVAGRRYYIEASDNLTTPAFGRVGQIVEGVDATNSVEITEPTADTRFYRIGVEN